MTTDIDTERRDSAEGAGGSLDLPTTPDEPYYRERARGEQGRRWGAVLLVIGVIWLVFAITSRGSLFGLGLGLVEHSAAIEPQSFSVSRVVVSGVNDELLLVGWGEDEVQLEGSRHGFGWNVRAADDALEQVEVVASQSGDTLTIEVRRPPSIGGFVGRAPYANLRISLPENVAVEAHTVNGEIEAEGLRGEITLGTVNGEIETEGTAGTIALNSTNGDVEVSDHSGAFRAGSVGGTIRASGDLLDPQVETVSGDVVLKGVRGTVTVSTISGSIAVDAARDAILNLESTSGDIRVDGSIASGAESRISNISGDVKLELPKDGDLRLDVSTVTGDISADLPLRGLVEERRHLSGTIGEGLARLTISTTSGDISLDGQ